MAGGALIGPLTAFTIEVTIMHDYAKKPRQRVTMATSKDQQARLQALTHIGIAFIFGTALIVSAYFLG